MALGLAVLTALALAGPEGSRRVDGWDDARSGFDGRHLIGVSNGFYQNDHVWETLHEGDIRYAGSPTVGWGIDLRPIRSRIGASLDVSFSPWYRMPSYDLGLSRHVGAVGAGFVVDLGPVDVGASGALALFALALDRGSFRGTVQVGPSLRVGVPLMTTKGGTRRGLEFRGNVWTGRLIGFQGVLCFVVAEKHAGWKKGGAK